MKLWAKVRPGGWLACANTLASQLPIKCQAMPSPKASQRFRSQDASTQAEFSLRTVQASKFQWHSGPRHPCSSHSMLFFRKAHPLV